MTTTSIHIRPADQRGVAEHGWLSSRFSFSFADYYDPEHMGYRSLRVISGTIEANGERLTEGDGAALSTPSELLLRGVEENSDVLLFDLA